MIREKICDNRSVVDVQIIDVIQHTCMQSIRLYDVLYTNLIRNLWCFTLASTDVPSFSRCDRLH